MSWFPRPVVRLYPALLLLALVIIGALVQASVVKPLSTVGDTVLYLSFVTGAVGLWLVIPLVPMVVALGVAERHAPRTARRMLWFALRVGLLAATFLVLKTVAARLLRLGVSVVFALEFPMPSLLGELRAEFPKDSLHFVLLVAIWSLFETRRQRDDAARRSAELQAAFAEARFAALGARLDGHFLFNALNTVGSLLHEDVPRAERLLHGLAQLLRAALTDEHATWSFAEEHAHTLRYLDFIEARFGDRVAVSWQLSAELAPLVVPRFALQTLVENAVKHNQSLCGELCIHVTGERRDDRAILEVRDNGLGFDTRRQTEPALAPGLGSGLSRLRELSRLIHGREARLSHRNLSPSGAEVQLSWPWPKLP